MQDAPEIRTKEDYYKTLSKLEVMHKSIPTGDTASDMGTAFKSEPLRVAVHRYDRKKDQIRSLFGLEGAPLIFHKELRDSLEETLQHLDSKNDDYIETMHSASRIRKGIMHFDHFSSEPPLTLRELVFFSIVVSYLDVDLIARARGLEPAELKAVMDGGEISAALARPVLRFFGGPVLAYAGHFGLLEDGS